MLAASGRGASVAASGPMVGFMISGCLAAVGGVIIGIWALVLLFWYRRRLNEAASQARSTWAKEPVQTSAMAPFPA
jgi:hypothetical protein